MDLETAETATRTRPSVSYGFIATSALASAVGVVVAALVDHLGIAVAGWVAGREPILYHNEVLFTAAGSDLALGGGMALTLIVGIFFLTLYPGSVRYDAARLTTLWVILHCFRQGFTELATVSVSEESSLARAFTTLDVPAGVDLVVAVAGVVGLLSVALASAPAFLGFAHKQSIISTPARRAGFTTRLALVPGAVGPLLAVPFFLPDNGTGFIQMLPLLGLFTVATVVASVGTRNVRIGDGRVAQGWSWLPLGWLLGLALLLQFVLDRGLLIPPSLDSLFASDLSLD